MHICFVALNSYNLFTSSRTITHIGGAEMQQYLMARWLANNGHQVTVVTLDHGQAAETLVDGIRIVKAYDVEHGLPLIRFFYPRWHKLVAALKLADADIYYQRGAGVETGQVATWCRRNHRPFVYATASQADCEASLPFLSTRRDRYLYTKGLKLASAVVVQSDRQVTLLRNSFNIAGHLIRSSGRVLGDPVDPARKKDRIIWLGRFSPEKRFEWVLEIAAQSREYEFLVLGASNDGSAYASELSAQAEALTNVKLVGHVPSGDVVRYYNQAKLLLLTSPLEGFPNVFVEAWQLGIPVLTSFDPDGIVSANELGWTFESPQDATEILSKLTANHTELRNAAQRSITYFRHNHTIEENMPIYLRLFQGLLTCRSR